jgi:hypothetical protein
MRPSTDNSSRDPREDRGVVIETMTFKLRAGVTDELFRAADHAVQVDFAYHQPGMIRRTTARGAHGVWMVLDMWDSPEHADACLDGWHHEPAPLAFTALLEEDTVRTERYETLD